MAMKTRYVVLNFNPTTKELIGISPQTTTEEEAREVCEALNPDDPKLKRCRVGVLVWDED